METRGIWITTTDSQVLDTSENIAQAMKFLAQTGFNVVMPVVWNKGMTLYPSQVMKETMGVSINPAYQGRDPLAELIESAHRHNLLVIPWFEYGFVSSYQQNGGLLLAKKPEWKAVDQRGNLLKKNGFEWMNALDPNVQNFLRDLVLEVVQNYEIDGIQGDDRMPAFPCEGGYDSQTAEQYYQIFHQSPPQNCKDPQWMQWRADILTEFLASLYQEIKAIKPDCSISMAPNIYKWCFYEYLQDTKAWMNRQLVDQLHPQIYRRDFQSYQQVLNQLLKQHITPDQRSKISPGILIKLGSYRITSEYLLQAIHYNRICGINGEILFFYEGLRENNDELAKALKNGPYSKPAHEPYDTQSPIYGKENQPDLSSWLSRIYHQLLDWLK